MYSAALVKSMSRFFIEESGNADRQADLKSSPSGSNLPLRKMATTSSVLRTSNRFLGHLRLVFAFMRNLLAGCAADEER